MKCGMFVFEAFPTWHSLWLCKAMTIQPQLSLMSNLHHETKLSALKQVWKWDALNKSSDREVVKCDCRRVSVNAETGEGWLSVGQPQSPDPRRI